MSAPNLGILFRGLVPTSTTFYIEVPVRDGKLGAHIGWTDGTSSATITLELTSHIGAGIADPTAWTWKDSGVSITGPAGSAAGASLVNVENVRQRRARLKVVTAAVSNLIIFDGTEAYP